MDKKAELKLMQVLQNNPAHPLVIAGESDIRLENFVSLDAGIDERELHLPTHWHKLLETKSKSKKAYLIISGLDKIDGARQEIFAPLLKDRRAGNFKLPANVQIVVPVADKSKLSRRILSLALVWDIA